MRTRRILAGVIIVCLVAVTTLLRPGRTKIIPPVVSVVRIESAGVDDDEGEEMRLVTLSIRNPNNAPFSNERLVVEKSLCVEDVRPIEVRVTNSWVTVKGGLGCYMSPGDKHETAFVVPAGANSLRASLKYTHAEIYKGRLNVLARRLPRFLRRRLPMALWQWTGFPQSRPSSDWQEVNIEIPFSSPLPLPEKEGLSSNIDAAK